MARMIIGYANLARMRIVLHAYYNLVKVVPSFFTDLTLGIQTMEFMLFSYLSAISRRTSCAQVGS